MDSSYDAYQQNYSIEIYEFSRELIDISQKEGRWLSGGFGAEVGKSNKDVPQKIRDAVNRGDFRINDNYSPKQQDYALIAREIDEYSVLAVATRVGDDKTRILVAYRYFWLDKPAHQDIDGIGTLLIWWIDSNSQELKFDFEWNPNSPPFTAKYYFMEHSHQYFDKYKSSDVESILHKINKYPFAFQIDEANSRKGLHYLALYLNREYRISISWAWNVGWLEHPERFTLICSDKNEKSHQYNSRDIQKYQKPLERSLVTTSPKNENEGKKPSEPPQYAPRVGNSHPPNVGKTPDALNNENLDQIRTCLKKIADNQDVETEMQKLVVFLEQYPNLDLKNNKIIDSSKKGYYNTSQLRYTALLAILGDISVSEWLGYLKQKNNKKDENAFLNIQKQLLDNSKKRDNKSVYLMLKNKIKKDISELLLTFKQANPGDTHQNIEWLLLKSNSIWVICFNEYAKKLVFKLIQGGEQGDDQFYNALQQNNSQGYKNLALLFKQLPNHSLSAYFYQVSEGSVPSDIYDKADTAITVPMRRVETNQGQNQHLNFQSFPNFLRNPLLIVLLILTCLASVGLLYSFNNKNTSSRIRPEQPASEKKLKSYMQDYRKKNDGNAKEEIRKKLKGLESPNKDMRGQEDYEYLKAEFIPKLEIQLTDSQNSSSSSPPTKKEEIKTLQTILQTLGYLDDKVEVKDTLDRQTKKAYDNFKTKNKEEISKNNDVDRQSTWKVLTNQFTDEQVIETAKFLLIKLESESNNQNNHTFDQDVKKLQECRKKESSLTYIKTCLK